jgi:hypothetical protein
LVGGVALLDPKVMDDLHYRRYNRALGRRAAKLKSRMMLQTPSQDYLNQSNQNQQGNETNR